MEQNKPWWRKPQRIIQPNLQVRDTALIDPERLAGQMKEMGASAVVFNVGGIYAWYPTNVPFHTVNPYLPRGFDLLEAVIAACHRQGLRFIARFDFSKAEDSVYLRQPQWFVRTPAGEPEVIGARRPGEWSLLMAACNNGGYRNEAVAIPVLDEALGAYDIDGVFFNAPSFIPCWCDGCRRKYAARYGAPLPDSRDDFAADWASSCVRDNMGNMYAFVKQKRPDIPMILYYNLYRDNLFDRERTADMLCTEPQDVLSLGHRHIPEFWKPALSMKLGRSLPERPAPLGIVHSSPGMDWRHTGLPPAEYRFWLSQIPAHGGSIWHSLTGIPETIGDKRILDAVAELNHSVRQVEPDMEDAAPLAQVALLWSADDTAEGWADGLINRQIPFDVLLEEQATPQRLAGYEAVVVPGGMRPADADALVETLREYARQGGTVLFEAAAFAGGLSAGLSGGQSAGPVGTAALSADGAAKLAALLGIEPETYVSEPLAASYLRFADGDNPLRRGLERTELIAHRGRVVYARPAGPHAQVLATLVPPFSPLESVGAPPERASLPVPRTDLPLAIHSRTGRGGALYLPFELSRLINEYKLGELYQLLANAVDIALSDRKLLEVTHYQGLQTTLFRKDGMLLVHLVNGAGRRPLATNIPLPAIDIRLRLNGRKATAVRQLIGGGPLAHAESDGWLRVTLPQLDVWECLLVELE